MSVRDVCGGKPAVIFHGRLVALYRQKGQLPDAVASSDR
jgi:hypothetical protein